MTNSYLEDIHSLDKSIRAGLKSAISRVLPIGVNTESALVLHCLVSSAASSSQELQAALSLSKSSVSEMLSSLVDAGLVVYSKSSEDARNKIIKPTERGIDLHQRIEEEVRSFEQSAFFGVDEDELRSLSSVMERIRWNIEEGEYGSR